MKASEEIQHWKGFDTSDPIVFLTRDKMNNAFIKMHQPKRVRGNFAAWQRCSLDFGVAGTGF